jgi:hypothetical protein
MDLLGISMAVMGLISIAIFEYAREGGVAVSVEGGRIRAFKGEEYEIVLVIESRATDWVDAISPTARVETAQLVKTEPLEGGRTRIRFIGTRAGRSEGLRVEISLTDPLKLFQRFEEVARVELVIDTLPLSLLAPAIPWRLTVFGFGDQSTGYPGPGQELYGLDEYHSGDMKDIIWKRVAKSSDERLTARVREANARDAVKVAVVHFVDRGHDNAAWVDSLCEALGHLGQQVLEMGASFAILYPAPPRPVRQDGMGGGGGAGGGGVEYEAAGWGERTPTTMTRAKRKEGGGGGRGEKPSAGSAEAAEDDGEEGAVHADVRDAVDIDRPAALAQARAIDVVELAEAVMACSVAPDSRDIARAVGDCDLLVTGLKEFEDERLTTLISGRKKPVLLISEDAPLPPGFGQRSGPMVYSGKESLFPLVRRILER